MNAIVKHEPAPAPAHVGLMPQNMEQAIRLAEMMARGKMLPAHLQNSPGDCLMIVEQAMRWRMSPFAVAQCTSSIKGKLMFEGKLLAAAIEESGAIVGSLDYIFKGEGANRVIIVSATRRGETLPRTVEVALKDAITDNPLWKRQPDQQLVYHGARVWGRRWTPGVILGVYSREEFSAGGVAFDGTTIEAAPESTTAQAIGDSIPALDAPAAPKKPSVTDWLNALGLELANAPDAEAVDAILARADVQSAFDKLRNGALERLKEITSDAIARTSAAATMET